MKKFHVTWTVSLPFNIEKKEKHFVSSCHCLDVWSQGETEEIAEKNLKEAVRLFLMDCFERGTLDKVLKECGFSAIKPPTRAFKNPPSIGHMDVPLPFVIDEHSARCRG